MRLITRRSYTTSTARPIRLWASCPAGRRAQDASRLAWAACGNPRAADGEQARGSPGPPVVLAAFSNKGGPGTEHGGESVADSPPCLLRAASGNGGPAARPYRPAGRVPA